MNQMSTVQYPISLSKPNAEMRGGWKWTELCQLARLESGHTPSRLRPDWWGGDVSWLSLTEIRALDGQWVEETRLRTNPEGIANSAARILPRGTVCLSRTASVGFVVIMGRPMAKSQDFANWVCGDQLDPEFLMYALIRSRSFLRSIAVGATHKTIYMPTLESFHLFHPDINEQKRIVSRLRLELPVVEQAREAAGKQLAELDLLPQKLLGQSHKRRRCLLGDVLVEVKDGIGSKWAEFPVLGATRAGLAPAKEQPGKSAERYKPVTAGTVFYNPMRILIGSIAFVDDEDEPGITSPDYVVLKGKPGVVDSRWFYYWLRSPWGEQCIQSLARGAVRERMLFNRLAEGEIELPDYDSQVKASKAMSQIRPLRIAIQTQLVELDLLPQKLLAQVFGN